jgi:hypothetical protein
VSWNLLLTKLGVKRRCRGLRTTEEPKLESSHGTCLGTYIHCGFGRGVECCVRVRILDIQSTTQNICECLCARTRCTYGAEFIPVSAACPSGTFVTGGGFRWQAEPNLARVQDSFPDAAGGAWTAIAKSPDESPCNKRQCENLTVHAVCGPEEYQPSK